MSAMQRTPLKKRRTGKPRRVLQVCEIRGCKRRADQAMCKSHAKLRADQAWSRYIRARDGRCMAAEAFPEIRCAGSLQAMHLISRRYAATRYAPWNGRAGCAAHHRWLTDRPLEHDEWCERLSETTVLVYGGSVTEPLGGYEGPLRYRHRDGPERWAERKRQAITDPPMSPIDFLASPEATAPTERTSE